MANPRDYFLLPQNFTDFDKYRGAVRKGLGITPIVDGKAIFENMEREVLKAKKDLLIAFWSFDPGLILLTKEGKAIGKNWLELLVHAAKENRVKVKLFMNDFDPLLQFEKHAITWLRYRVMVNFAKKAGVKPELFQIVVSRHETEIPKTTAALAGLTGLDALVAAQLNAAPFERRAKIFANAPGLWSALRWDERTRTVQAKKKDAIAPAFPGSHHQKFIWIDGRLAFVGGINLIGENLDTPKHQREKLPWHDIFVLVEGGPLRDIRRNFIGLWNRERLRMKQFLKTANAVTNVPAGMPEGKTTELSEKLLKMSAPRRGVKRIPAQVHRTISHNSKGNVPQPIRTDVLEGKLKAIELAEKFIYIENQYFRSKELADAIIARHQKVKQLKTIIVLPLISEEMLVNTPDAITLHGVNLQFKALDRMQKAIGTNLGLFGLKVKDKQIYVHSKLMIIDDLYSNVGSANDNPRSFLMDTELNLAWYDPTSTAKMRLMLWREHLGAAKNMIRWKPHQFVEQWNKIAKRNVSVAPNRRQGFVVPFINTEEGKKNPLIPDEFANLLEPGDVRIV